MKKSVIITISIVSGIGSLVLAVILLFVLCNTNRNAYGVEYETHWKSTDGHFELTNNNRMGMSGVGTYDGKYYANGNIYAVVISINGYENTGFSDARFVPWKSEDIYAGDAKYDRFTNTYTVKVERVANEVSVYKPGDEIVFYQVD